MVTHRQPANQPGCLGQLVTDQLQQWSEGLRQRQIATEIDIDPTVQSMPVTRELQGLMANLLSTAIDRSPDGGLLLIYACRSLDGIVIEVADDGPDPAAHQSGFDPPRPLEIPHSVAPEPMTHASYRTHCARCPQGGVAWTLLLDSPAAARRAA